MSIPPGAPPVFVERPTEPIVRDALALALAPAVLGGLAAFAGHGRVALVLLGIAIALCALFRNPARAIPGDDRTVVSPADGRVIAIGEVEDAEGSKRLRIAIFLSLFHVHVTRAPLAGRVVSVERRGAEHLPAFNPEMESRNVACALTLETARGERVSIVQITGLVARRLVCHPRVGEWVARGARYGLIRLGSRTDVLLPAGARPRVRLGDRVFGGSSAIAVLEAFPA